MTTRKAKAIPEVVRKKSTREEILARLDQVMDEDSQFVIVSFTPDEYNSVESARNSLNSSADRYGYPLHFYSRYDKLYAMRTDM